MTAPVSAVIDRDASDEAIEIEAIPGETHRIAVHAAPPTYTLRTEVGDFEAIFGSPSTAEGELKRMQACGFFNGNPASTRWKTRRRTFRWYMRKEIAYRLGQTHITDEQFEHKKRTLLRSIVSKAEGPILPIDHFGEDAKILLPGTHLFEAYSSLDNDSAPHRFNRERLIWENNPALGKIPLVATVLNGSNPVADMLVAFEFIAPFNPIDDRSPYVRGLSDSHPRGSSPQSYVFSVLTNFRHPVFCSNAGPDQGGKTPDDVFGTLVESQVVGDFPYLATTENRPNTYTVTCRTDHQGRAGIVFNPSRIAGDAYKIKVYLIPAGRDPLPQEIQVSGIWTVWRILRISRLIVKPPVAGYSSSPHVDARFLGDLGNLDFGMIQTEYAKAFFHVEKDRQFDNPVILDEERYRHCIQYVKANHPNPYDWNLDRLVLEDINSPFLIWIEDDGAYNSSISGSSEFNTLELSIPGTWENLKDFIINCLELVGDFFDSENIPGITIIRGEVGDSYSNLDISDRPMEANGGLWQATTSGIARVNGVCFIWYPENWYSNFSYSLTANVMHEIGHLLYLRHYHTHAHADGSFTGGAPLDHDPTDNCIMGYLMDFCDDYCGKCLLKLRGWKEDEIQTGSISP